jgi:hypothetical protein
VVRGKHGITDAQKKARA